MVLQDLVTSDDPDYDSFNEQDPDFFLRVVGQAIRTYCDWHIFPSLVVTNEQQALGSNGSIILPTKYLTDVALITVDGTAWDVAEYNWDPAGFITRDSRHNCFMNADYAQVSYTHGYDAVPLDLKSVIFELASNATEMPAGLASRIASPGYQISLGEFGVSLTPSMKSRLADYRRTVMAQ